MIQVRRVYSTALPVDRERVVQVQEIFRSHFAAIADYAEKIPDQMDHPFKFGYQSILLVAENGSGVVLGFSLFFHLPEINSSLLDFLAIRHQGRGGGLGSVLYEATREYLVDLKSRGLYMEVLPDDPSVVKEPDLLKENRRRLKFYEQFGVRPIVGTEYETPIDSAPAPYLLFDGLGRKTPLSRSEARAAARLILKRKYTNVVPPDYIERVVESFIDNPVQFRPLRYVKDADIQPPIHQGLVEKRFTYVMGRHYALHQVKERGYVERPARVGALQEAVSKLSFFDASDVRHFPEKDILAVHGREFVQYLRAVCEKLNTARPVYPYVFPIRRPDRRPKDLSVRAGYYCIDTFTPLDRNAYTAAREAVDVALTGAHLVSGGRRVVYTLCRPPGHHAERNVFGGFCYFNNGAVAAQYLSSIGKVAILDIDYHHGNGAQDIFYKRADVLTLSIHGHPNVAYPYFSGFADEKGEGPGTGFNRNYPLREDADEVLYLETLDKALGAVRGFAPTFLVVALGLDTIKGDPTGTFLLKASSLRTVGQRIGAMNLPTLVVQEGGYSLTNLRRGSVQFFTGLYEAAAKTTG